MGFTSGLLGGFTLTASLLYLTTHLHRTNRTAQAHLLRQQSLLLNQIVDPTPPPPEPLPREVPAGLWETAKDKWNAELESNVRKLWSTDWNAVRERAEEGVSSVWRKAFSGAREGVEVGVDKAQEGLEVAGRKVREGIDVGVEKARQAVKWKEWV